MDNAECGAEAEEREDEVEEHGGLAATLDDARCHFHALSESSLFPMLAGGLLELQL